MSSEEEGAMGPTSVEGNSSLLSKIAELEQEKAAMAQQLECQLALIKQLQQQMADLQAINMAGKQPVQQEQQQQLLNHQRHQQQQQRKHQRQEQQQQQRQQQQQPEEDDGMCLEVILQEEEGNPFNFVQRRKKSNRKKVSATINRKDLKTCRVTNTTIIQGELCAFVVGT
ncbi:serum response factor homolog A-like [Hermetia illucens]|uniref:serum response factor homolog A-like n=1 Tax=Hermetia illucens TaxID=343691 RepID=UPI0018CC13A1|nr:serum response factor homolog A-like [Hermetia illucens]